MKKAQLSMEAVGAVSLIMLLFTAALGLKLNLQDEMADRTMLLVEDVDCSDLSAALNAVYSNGPGAETVLVVGGNFTVRPGLVELGTTDGTYYCNIDNNAIDGVTTLTARTYTIKNVKGKVEFT
ncbi:MAG: hypothetical protein V1744_06125 [Candidatus Altiarchaeota archaeon]